MCRHQTVLHPVCTLDCDFGLLHTSNEVKPLRKVVLAGETCHTFGCDRASISPPNACGAPTRASRRCTTPPRRGRRPRHRWSSRGGLRHRRLGGRGGLVPSSHLGSVPHLLAFTSHSERRTEAIPTPDFTHGSWERRPDRGQIDFRDIARLKGVAPGRCHVGSEGRSHLPTHAHFAYAAASVPALFAACHTAFT